MIPYGKQHITEQDILAVTEALKGDYLTQGPTILAFEQAFAQYIGCKYAVAVSNGTAALHLSVLALGVSEGDKVIFRMLLTSSTVVSRLAMKDRSTMDTLMVGTRTA